ncbi:MAG: hypothetical protein PT936_03540 [Treponema sp.]|nr:hypothetical protein [Treponema sp.]
MNKITKKHVIKFLSLFTFMLFSCQGLFDSQKIESKQEGPFVVTGRISNSMDSSASGARTASSSKNESEKFWYKVTATPSEPTLEVKETIVSSKDYSFVLDKGTWTFYVEAYLVATSDDITDSTIPILVSDNLEYNISSSSVTLPPIQLKFNTAANATGTFSLPIDVTGTGIESCKVEFTNILDGIKPDGFTANADTVSETGREIITLQPGSNISAGYYLMRMEFYNGTNGTGLRLYSRTEMITIYPGASSTSYVVKWNNENNLLEITTSLIEGNRNHEVYVDSSASVSGSGGFFDPFNTFTQAMDYINTVNDGNDANIDYSIILCNDITGAPASGSDTFIEIEPHHLINLTIKSKPESEIYKIQPTESSRGISFKGIDGGACLFTLQNVAITGYGTSTDNTAPLGAYVYENATVQLTGATYIDYIAVENDAPVIKIPSELEKIYKTADNKYSIEETGNTLLKNFIYVPQTSYAEDKQYLSGDGLATSYMNIGIEDQQLADSKKQKWEFLSTGYIQKFFLYAKNLTSIPAAGDTVYIKDAADLYALQTLVNSGYLLNADGSKNFLSTTGISFENVTFEQLEDIDLTTNDNTKKWVPIGKTYSTLVPTSYPFSGNYAGNNKTINILMSYSSGTELTLGLFGYVKNGSVKDITVSGSITTDGDSTVKLAAGVVSYLEGGTVDGCVNDVLISIKDTVSGAKIGGIVADAMSASKITNCISKKIVSVANANTTVCMGGIAGSAYGTLIDNVKNEKKIVCSSDSGVTAETGGIVGYLCDSKIYNSINRGQVLLLSDGHAGGIVGSLFGTENKIYNCYNDNIVSVYNGYSAGIVGYAAINQSQTSVDIQNCVSYENINENDSQKSGIINVVNSTASDPDTIGTISNCYWYIPSGITLEMKGPDGSGTTVENCSSFTLNSPADEWYGTLASPVNAGEKTGIKALVYALNSWVDYANKTPLVSDVTFKNVCFDETNGLEFGAPPEGEPPAAPTGSLSSEFIDNIKSLNTGGTTVYVKTAEDLKAFAALVNSGSYGEASATLEVTDKTFTDITVEQTADIDLTDLYDDSFTSWIPIGTTEGYTTKWFKGTYNGNGNQISNLNINATTDIAPALFGNVQNGTIQNVIVSGSVVCSSGDYVAGLVNCLVSGTLENCVSNVNVKNTSAYTTSITGGIVASVKGGSKVLNCTNNGSIENTGNSNFAGGIAGVSDSTSTNLFINCKNNGSVITSSTDISSSAGGIISTNKGQLNIFNCINYGKIETKNNAGYGGGILGANRTESYRVNIYNCVNNASVNNFSGNYGIIGYIQANSTIYVKYCYNNSSKVSELFDTTSSITSENNQNTSFTEGYEESIVTELNANISKFSDLYGYEYCHNWAYESAKGLYLVPPPVVANPPIAGHTYASTMASAPSSGTVYIRESADLQQISNWSQSSTLENVTFEMDYDVSLDGIEWIPIGNVSNPFGGCFDGNNKSIINFNNDSAGDGFALFNRATNASLKNIDISGQITVTTGSSPYSAGIVVMADGCNIENCKSNVNITSAIEGSCIAGIAANLTGNPSTISNCLNLGTMDISKKTSKAGGIVAYVSINSSNTTFIRNVENKGNIKHSGTATSSINLGGIVGFADTNSGGVIVIENSGNKGTITSNANNTNASVGDSSKVHAGGIIGFESYSKADNKVLNCFNVGEISGANINAAIVATGSTAATIEYCYFDSTKCEMWKDSSKEETDTVKKTYADSGYNVSITVNSTDCHYVTTALNTWIQSQSNSSLYKTWNNIIGDNSATGYGEPVLPIEQTP